MKTLPLFVKTKGLNTVIDCSESGYSQSSGVSFLAEALDVCVSDTGKIVRRSGFVKKTSGDYHSMFSYLGLSLLASGDSIYRLNPDYSTTLVKSGLTTGATYDYVGVNEDVYYTNGHEIGIIGKNAEWKSWSFTQYVGPVKNKTFQQPPVGHLITYHNGRMYMAVDNAVFHSEPFFYAAFDFARGYIPFSSRIRLLKAIPDGIFIGTEKEIFFLKGTGPADFQMETVADYPALINLSSMTTIDGQYIASGKMFIGKCAVIPTTKGICIGGKSWAGYFKNISIDSIKYPSALYCSALVQKDKILILINE